MSKNRTKFFCRECGQESARWFGRCPGCGEWNTLVEEVVERAIPKAVGCAQVTSLNSIQVTDEERLDTGIGELNRVLGGGIVPGSFVLIGGEPGIGKSTLLLQMASNMAGYTDVLYVSGEESAKQIRLRADRLDIRTERIKILVETELEAVREVVLQQRPGVVIIDSIQTMVMGEVQSAAGSVSQVREGAAYLMRLAKGEGIPIFLVGHVTKDGAIAGPRVLEHIVDTVLYFEGDRHHVFRLLRAVKNRFGATNEIGVFEMQGAGLVEVANPSQFFLGEGSTDKPGSAVVVVMEGSRPLLIEIQALVTENNYAQLRRTANGIDYNRVLMLLAVLDKRLGLRFASQDVFVNIVGGVKADEPAADLALVMALVSSCRDLSLRRLAFIGEVGLSGEVRGVAHIENRIREAIKLGFDGCVIPRVNHVQASGVEFPLFPVATVEEAVRVAF